MYNGGECGDHSAAGLSAWFGARCHDRTRRFQLIAHAPARTPPPPADADTPQTGRVLSHWQHCRPVLGCSRAKESAPDAPAAGAAPTDRSAERCRNILRREPWSFSAPHTDENRPCRHWFHAARTAAAAAPDDARLQRAAQRGRQGPGQQPILQQKPARLGADHARPNPPSTVTGGYHRGWPRDHGDPPTAAQWTRGKSIGLNIVLPFERAPTIISPPELFSFHYFAIRKIKPQTGRALVACRAGWHWTNCSKTLTLIGPQE